MEPKTFGQSSYSKERIFLFIMWAIIIAFFVTVRSILLPFILSVFLAYVLHPLVVSLQKISIRKKHLSKAWSVIILYLVIFIITFLSFAIIVPQIYKESSKLLKEASEIANNINESTVADWSFSLNELCKKYNLPFDVVIPNKDIEYIEPYRKTIFSIDIMQISNDLINNILNYSKTEVKNIFFSAQIVLNKLISFFFISLLVFMITAFMLIDYKKIKDFLFKLVPMQDKNLFDDFLINLDIRLSGVIRGQLIICLVNGLLTLIGLLILQIKYAFTLAIIAGIFSIIPVFGSIISTIPIFFIGLSSSLLSGILSLIWISIIHIIEANLLNPKIMGYSAEIHPILIILSLLVGEHFYGIIGALLAVPFIGVIITVYSSILAKWQESLLSSGCKS